ncbi:MAG: GNAT family N-acetyltransferase [Kiritimatiellae bacterium]|nr:GNAT family N-acetyltransferase [Kiritimatiellia bacterium]
MNQLVMYHLMDALVEHPMPEGFFVRKFRKGEEAVWIEINKCGIFGPDAGMEGWESMVVKMNGLVPERDILFATLADDIPVATLTAYIRDDGVGVIHMVSALESVRGRGIGKALLAIGMKKLRAAMPPPPFTQLLTDDWRLPAIKVYLDAGFHPVNVSEDMPDRWRKVCAALGIHGVEMLDTGGKGTGILM